MKVDAEMAAGTANRRVIRAIREIRGHFADLRINHGLH
jgi:hypothetical protein